MVKLLILGIKGLIKHVVVALVIERDSFLILFPDESVVKLILNEKGLLLNIS